LIARDWIEILSELDIEQLFEHIDPLFSSLTAHAGTQVQSLAEVQVQLGRQGSTISFEDGRTVVLVPLAPAS
jgi:hypothetical protein